MAAAEVTGWSRYTKRKQLGRGAYGVVYLATDKLGGTDAELVAVKCLSLGALSEEESRRAMSEVAILRNLEHTNILRYIDCFIDDQSTLCLVTEFVDGGDLESLLLRATEEGNPLTAIVIADVGRQLLEGLDYLHHSGVLHRDIKPANVYLTTEGVIKIGDFGVSKMLSASMSRAVTFIGTPYYVAPELCMGEPYGFGADIWAFGVLLYEAFCGKLPFEASNMLALVNKICSGAYNQELLEKKSRALHLQGREDIEAVMALTVGNLIEASLILDPCNRPTASALLARFFTFHESPISHRGLSEAASAHEGPTDSNQAEGGDDEFLLEQTCGALEDEVLNEADVATELPWDKDAELFRAMEVKQGKGFQVEIHVDPMSHELVVTPRVVHVDPNAEVPHFTLAAPPSARGKNLEPPQGQHTTTTSTLAFASLRRGFDPRQLEMKIKERAALLHRKRHALHAKLRKQREEEAEAKALQKSSQDPSPLAGSKKKVAVLSESQLATPAGLPATTPSPLKRLVRDRPELLSSVRAIVQSLDDEEDELMLPSMTKKGSTKKQTTVSRSQPVVAPAPAPEVPPPELANDDRIRISIVADESLMPGTVTELATLNVTDDCSAKRLFRRSKEKMLKNRSLLEQFTHLSEAIEGDHYEFLYCDNSGEFVVIDCSTSWKYCVSQITAGEAPHSATFILREKSG